MAVTITMPEMAASVKEFTEASAKMWDALKTPTFDTLVKDYAECEDKEVVPFEALPPLTTEAPVDRFRREVKAVVREMGRDYKYIFRPHGNAPGQFGAYYVWDGKPDCLVGRVLARMGVPVEMLARVEHNSANVVVGMLWGRGALAGDLTAINKVAELAVQVQGVNDSRQEWGWALQF